MSQVGLKVVSWVCSEDFHDNDDIPMDSWTEDDPKPCFYVGAWADSLDFIGKSNHIAVDQQLNPQRHYFVFNSVPDTMAGIEEAITEWAQR